MRRTSGRQQSIGVCAISLVTGLLSAAGHGDGTLLVMIQNIFYRGADYDLATGDFCQVPDG